MALSASPQSGVRGVTVKDVAARARVHHSSVSVALNGAKSGTNLSDETRARILDAARELGYKRNGSMVAAKTGRFGQVALLVSTDAERSYLPQGLWEGIHDALALHDLTLCLARLPDEKLASGGVAPKMLREWMCDGLLVDLTHRIPERLMEMIHEHQLPAVWLNIQLEADCVFPDDFAAGWSATEHLLKLGHTRIAYLDVRDPDAAHEHGSLRARRDGFLAAMKQARLKPTLWLNWRETKRPAETLVDKAARELSGAKRPTAILSYAGGDLEIVVLASERLGLHVPRDLSFATFESAPLSFGGVTISTWCVPEREIGARAVEVLRRKIEAPAEAQEPVSVPFQMSDGATTAAPALP